MGGLDDVSLLAVEPTALPPAPRHWVSCLGTIDWSAAFVPDYLFMLSWSRGVSFPPFLQIFATLIGLISVKFVNIDSLKRKIVVAV